MRGREKSEYPPFFSIRGHVYGNRCFSNWHLLPLEMPAPWFQLLPGTPLPPFLVSGSTTSSLYLCSQGQTTTSTVASYWDALSSLAAWGFFVTLHWLSSIVKTSVVPAFLVRSCLWYQLPWLCQNLRAGRQSTFGPWLSMQLIHGPVVQRRDPRPQAAKEEAQTTVLAQIENIYLLDSTADR